MAELLEMSQAAVGIRRDEDRLLALPLDDGTWVFPTWQFADGELLPGLDAIFKHMSVKSPWMRAAFFLSSDIRLGGRTPLEVLRRGDVDAVRSSGIAYGEQLAS